MTREQFIFHVEGTQKAFRRFLVALCCGDTQLADDLAQEAYIKAYLSCDDFNNPDKFGAWIFRIGYNTFISNKRLLKTFVKERTTVLLHYMEGYSIKEIAEIVETTPEAVKTHLWRGRNHLRHLLNDE